MLATRIGLGVLGLACMVLTVIYGASSLLWLGTTLAALGLAYLTYLERRAGG